MQKDNRAGLMNHGLLFIKCNRVNDCRHSRKRACTLCLWGRGVYSRGVEPPYLWLLIGSCAPQICQFFNLLRLRQANKLQVMASARLC